jgi:hypothetical protein
LIAAYYDAFISASINIEQGTILKFFPSAFNAVCVRAQESGYRIHSRFSGSWEIDDRKQ